LLAHGFGHAGLEEAAGNGIANRSRCRSANGATGFCIRGLEERAPSRPGTLEGRAPSRPGERKRQAPITATTERGPP